MPNKKYTPRPLTDPETSPFFTSEEAWFWFSRCQKLRKMGARFCADAGDVVRPCDPDDIYRVVRKLFRHRTLKSQHVRVLNDYGERESPPDPYQREEERDSRLWDEALDRMHTEFRRKGIVE